MKKRALSLLLALVLVLSLAPAALAYDGQEQAYGEALSLVRAPEQQDAEIMESDPPVTGWAEPLPYPVPETPASGTRSLYGASIDENEVYRILNSFRSVYPERMYWTNESEQYMLSVPIHDERTGKTNYWIGYGCVAFCYRLSDAAFGSLSARNVYNFTYDDVRTGDILRVNNDTHSVTVLKKYNDHVVLAEANYNSYVHWDRTMTRAEVMASNYITTRYPSAASALTSVDISLDKTRLLPGERVNISIQSPITVPYNIEIWKGAKDSGELEWVDYDVDPTNSYWFSTYGVGTYTVYVETYNTDGQRISGTATFTISDGKPYGAEVSTDKSSYILGDTVWISYSASDADSYNISIWQGAYGTGTQLTSQTGFTTGTATYKPNKTGTYTLYVEAVNDYGTASATCQFTVGDSRPSNVTITADRSAFVVGEPFYVTVTATDMTGFNAELWRGEYGAGTRTASESNFGPNDRIKITVTLAERYTIYVEAYNDYGKTTATLSVNVSPSAGGLSFTDVPKDAYYAGAVDWAVRNEITYGTGGNLFSPGSTVTRGEAVTFLWRAMGRPMPSGLPNKFTDVKSSDYYFEAVQWAAENGVTTGMNETEFDPDGAVTRGQMITFLWRVMGKPGATGQGEWYADAEYWARSNSLLLGTSTAYATDAGCPRCDVVYYMWNTLK